MNNAKMWLVVKPTVGIPLFLSAVAIGSFAVHVSVLTNTSWVSDFLKGQPMGTGDQTAAAQPAPDAPQTATHAIPAREGEFTIVLPDGTLARVVMQPPEQVAAAERPSSLRTE